MKKLELKQIIREEIKTILIEGKHESVDKEVDSKLRKDYLKSMENLLNWYNKEQSDLDFDVNAFLDWMVTLTKYAQQGKYFNFKQ